jgi:hypothetical protein
VTGDCREVRVGDCEGVVDFCPPRLVTIDRGGGGRGGGGGGGDFGVGVEELDGSEVGGGGAAPCASVESAGVCDVGEDADFCASCVEFG